MNKIDYPALTSYLFWSELKSDMNKFMLGALWWVLEPALYVAVFYFLFAELRGRADFALVLVCGIVTWQWLIGIITSGASSVLKKKNLVQNFRVHPFAFPVVILLVNTFKYGVVLSFAIALFIWKDAFNPGTAVDFGLWFSAAIITAFSYAVLFSVATPFFPDLQMVISRAAMLMMFLSGVIFPISQMSPEAQALLYWNPFAHLIEGVRDLLLYGEAGDRQKLLIILVSHIPILLISYTLLSRLRGEIPKRLV
ncbi:ABC transporter permease [Biformimicrobium ophioploci]|uniref:Transport permease protein n=1 Tax=Biformimicrobium ophioploci TaxID=3036711 RepID=A0ABQ6M2Z9_9GAMM|nr:ABC transporter permease [Microbulbifer sp. NKW57]GMG88731.1 hypothetical protein MNKW57_30520 [Microbulbifer sp. NKW57]